MTASHGKCDIEVFVPKEGIIYFENQLNNSTIAHISTRAANRMRHENAVVCGPLIYVAHTATVSTAAILLSFGNVTHFGNFLAEKWYINTVDRQTHYCY